jgi:hypothetical protein
MNDHTVSDLAPIQDTDIRIDLHIIPNGHAVTDKHMGMQRHATTECDIVLYYHKRGDGWFLPAHEILTEPCSFMNTGFLRLFRMKNLNNFCEGNLWILA